MGGYKSTSFGQQQAVAQVPLFPTDGPLFPHSLSFHLRLQIIWLLSLLTSAKTRRCLSVSQFPEAESLRQAPGYSTGTSEAISGSHLNPTSWHRWAPRLPPLPTGQVSEYFTARPTEVPWALTRDLTRVQSAVGLLFVAGEAELAARRHRRLTPPNA